MRFLVLLLVTGFLSVNFSCTAKVAKGLEPNERQVEADTLEQVEEIVATQFSDYTIHSYYSAHLDNDKRKDILIILEKECDPEMQMEGALCRKTVLLINKSTSEYKVEGSNDLAIDCSVCGGAGVGDPLQGIRISNGQFTYELLYGSCDKTYRETTFQYDKKADSWVLTTIYLNSYSCNTEPVDGEIPVNERTLTSKDFGKVLFKDYDNPWY